MSPGSGDNMSVASEGKSNDATINTDIEAADPLSKFGKCLADLTLNDTPPGSFDEANLRSAPSLDTTKASQNPLDRLLDLVGDCWGVEESAGKKLKTNQAATTTRAPTKSTNQAASTTRAPTKSEPQGVASKQVTKAPLENHPSLDETEGGDFLDFIMSGGFEPISYKITTKRPLKPSSATQSVAPVQSVNIASMEDVDKVISCRSSGTLCDEPGLEADAVKGSQPVEATGDVDKVISSLSSLSARDEQGSDADAVDGSEAVEVALVRENKVDESDLNEDKDELMRPARSVKVMSLAEFSSCSWVIEGEDNTREDAAAEDIDRTGQAQAQMEDDSSMAQVEVTMEEGAPTVHVLEEGARTVDVQDQKEEMAPIVQAKAEEEMAPTVAPVDEETAENQDTKKANRAEGVRAYIAKKAAEAEAAKDAKLATRQAKLEQREATKRERNRRREAIKAAKTAKAKSFSTTLLGGNVPLKTEKKQHKTQDSTTTKKNPINAVKVVTVVEAHPAIVERTVTFDEEQVSVHEDRDTLESRTTTTVTKAKAPVSNPAPVIPADRPKMKIMAPNAWIKRSSGSFSSWLGSHLSTEEPELLNLEEKGSWLEEHKRQQEYAE